VNTALLTLLLCAHVLVLVNWCEHVVDSKFGNVKLLLDEKAKTGNKTSTI